MATIHPPALANGQSNGDYPLFCRFLQWCRKLLLVTQALSKYGYILIFSSPQGEARENTWVGTFHCDPGYTLASRYDVCNSLVKQRSIGKTFKMSNWLTTFPLFWQLGMCGSKTKSCQYQDFFRQGYNTCVKYFCFVFCPPFLPCGSCQTNPPFPETYKCQSS